MLLQARLVPEFDDDRRASERQAVNRPSTLRDESRAACDVYVRDLSETGFGIASDAKLTIGSVVSIGLPGHGRATARVVRPVNGGYGCEFTDTLSATAISKVFQGNTVIRLSSSAAIELPLPEPEVTKLPGAVRVATILGSSALLWAAIAMVVTRVI